MTVSTVDISVVPGSGWVEVASTPTAPWYLKPNFEGGYRFAITASTAPSAVATAATGVFTFSGQPNNGGTVTVGDITYTWVTSFDDPGDYDIKIGSNQAASEAVLTEAINGRAIVPATAATGSVIFAGLPTATQTVLIGSETYTFVALRAAPFEVTIGADATGTGDNLVTALTADSTLVSGINTTGTVALTADAAGFASNYALSTAATNTSVSGATMTGGNDEAPAIAANPNATAVDGAGTVTVTAQPAGTLGNSIALSDNSTNIATTAFTGGLNPVKGALYGANPYLIYEGLDKIPAFTGKAWVKVDKVSNQAQVTGNYPVEFTTIFTA